MSLKKEQNKDSESTTTSEERKIAVFGGSVVAQATSNDNSVEDFITRLNTKNIGEITGYGDYIVESGDIKSTLLTTLDQNPDNEYHEILILAESDNVCESWEIVKEDLQDMYTYAKKSKNLRVGALTALPFKGHFSWKPKCQEGLEALNNWIMQEAIDVDFRVDLYTKLVDPNDNQKIADSLTVDFYHPNSLGHERITDEILLIGYS